MSDTTTYEKGDPDLVRETCKYVRENATHVKVDSAAITRFLQGLAGEDWSKHTSVVNFPLQFNSLEAEVNFIALISLLNIGSGFRKSLHAARDRGAYETIQYGMMSMHLAGVKINAKFLADVTTDSVREYFDIPFLKEKEVQPRIYAVEKNELYQLAEHLKNLCNTAGIALKHLNKNDFAEVILPLLKEKLSAVALVKMLVKTFAGFDDKAIYKGKDVVLYKKAQLLVGELYRAFRTKHPELFDFPDIDKLTVFTDNVLPAVLRKLEILVLDEELAKFVDNASEIAAGSEYEVELRACAVAAAEEIVEQSRNTKNPFNSLLLDYYLWSKGKEGDFRTFERHYTRDTIFY